MIKKQKQAIEYIRKFIANSKHEESSCVVFDGVETESNKLTLYVQMYLGTWVLPHMIDVLNELENGV